MEVQSSQSEPAASVTISWRASNLDARPSFRRRVASHLSAAFRGHRARAPGGLGWKLEQPNKEWLLLTGVRGQQNGLCVSACESCGWPVGAGRVAARSAQVGAPRGSCWLTARAAVFERARRPASWLNGLLCSPARLDACSLAHSFARSFVRSLARLLLLCWYASSTFERAQQR